MARYADPTDLIKYGAPAAALAGIATEDQEAALEAASRELDARWSQRFTLPLTAWGEDVRQYACWVATYSLLKVRGLRPGSDDHEILTADRKEALKWAQQVGQGMISPAGLVDSTPTVDEARFIVSSQPKRGW